MINFDIFLLGIMAVSTTTGLVTEAIKNLLVEHNVAYRANTLAGIVSAVLSAVLGVGYVFATNIGFSAQVIVYIIALVIVSWLCSMVGYDKVMQTIKQFKTNNEE